MSEEQEQEQPFEEITTGQEKPAKKGLLEELDELQKSGQTSTARYRELVEEVEVIYGTGETNRFGTNDLEVLKKKLSRMTKADLQTFSKKVGVNPRYDRENLVSNLIKEFHRYQSRGNIATAPQPVPAMTLDPNDPQHKEILDWLGG